jgi:hypothetical protein
VGSFWWLNARQGKLTIFEPHSFAAAVTGSAVLLLRFPLVLYNTGPKPIVVQNLRVTFPDVATSLQPLPWRTSRRALKPDPSDDPQMPAVFAVPGRAAEQHFIEFGGPFPGFQLEAKDYRVRIEGLLGHKKGWRPLLEFTLRAGHITYPDSYITYGNSPRDVTPEDIAKATAALAAVMQRLGNASPPIG